VSWQTAEPTLTLFICNWQPVTTDSENAEVKLMDTSKFELFDVMALSWMLYCELLERAVLGKAAEEETVKLSCPSTKLHTSRKHIIGSSFMIFEI
jgi:hypothetical protein